MGLEAIATAVIGAMGVVLAPAVAVLMKRTKEAKHVNHNTNVVTKKSIQMLLRSQLILHHDKATSRGYITYAERQSFNDMMRQYTYLNGNGSTQHLERDIGRLPIRGHHE